MKNVPGIKDIIIFSVRPPRSHPPPSSNINSINNLSEPHLFPFHAQARSIILLEDFLPYPNSSSSPWRTSWRQKMAQGIPLSRNKIVS